MALLIHVLKGGCLVLPTLQI